MSERFVSESYKEFALVYDALMDNVPYQEWAKFLMDTLREYGVGRESRDIEKRAASAESGGENLLMENLREERNTVVDLGCGTGTLTEILAQAGFDMIGIDHSEEMLEAAMEKRWKSGSSILYLLQDMREFELFGTAGAAYSLCDSLNYILNDSDMVKVFSLVNNYLYPGGVFIFDFNTVYKYERIIGNRTIAENREDCSFIWENYYDKKERINEYDITFFIREQNRGNADSFRRFLETHYQRGYTLEQMQDFLRKAGLSFVRAIDADTGKEVREKSGRIFVIAQETKKQRGNED